MPTSKPNALPEADAANPLRAFYLREAKREWTRQRWKKWRHELYVFLVACALIAAVAWAVGSGR